MLILANISCSHTRSIPAVRLQNDETLITLSKAAYLNLNAQKALIYKGRTYLVIPDKTGFNLKGTRLNSTYAQTNDCSSYMWVLNNPDFPLILEIKSRPYTGNISMSVLTSHPERVSQNTINYIVTGIK